MAQGVPGRLRSRIFLTFRHYKGGRWSVKRTGRLYPRRNPWYSLSEAESTSGHMVLSGVPRKKSPVTPPGIELGTVLLVAQRLNHYATQAPKGYIRIQKVEVNCSKSFMFILVHFSFWISRCGRPQWPRGLRRGSPSFRLLGTAGSIIQIRIIIESMYYTCECKVC